MKPTFAVRQDKELTGRYVVTFHEDAVNEGLAILADKVGLRDLLHTNDMPLQAINVDREIPKDGAVFDELGICVVNCEKTLADRIKQHVHHSPIMEVEEEHQVHAMEPTVSSGKNYLDTANESWGMRAIGATNSKWMGDGIRIALLDTGVDSDHVDFAGRNIVGDQTFLADAASQDTFGHGTHCAGTIFGPRKPVDAPGYGIAPNAELLVGHVIDENHNGTERSLLAGLNWAIAQKCHVVSLSVGAPVDNPSVAFEQVGIRALKRGCLIVASAGNSSEREKNEFGFVHRPANNRSILAVGAVDADLSVADFSVRGSKRQGGEIDLVAPGVDIFSAWTRPQNYRSISGTSMATPFVAACAVLHAEATGLRGAALWDALEKAARPVPGSHVDIGAGMVAVPEE